MEMSNLKFDRWVITAWSPLVCRKTELLKYLIYQAEYTADGLIHFQGYVEFKKPYCQKTVKGLFSQRTMHIEPARESRSANVIYCTKTRSYAGIKYLFDGVNVYHTNDNKLDEIKLDFEELDDVFSLESTHSVN